ncbi:histidine kinase [Burkholderia cepacia]|uniref:ATP-binding protein n=1 Tax=Burkholderia cepacia TaxID=292 RepID=UPI00075EF72C|nr:transporter substrate-binding domain-containing protein [Burkholderia cepacia]KVA43477.1 histidine kinase [Burkholderia cepacia]KVA52663.1 histidine kinase [Burkholderia cepacia]KVA70906.1 histidine kinase [Burkholderia cepacia]KVA82689.1 histidine kinase [Burkholderia cepacia]KVA83029.1 histidine kinase [Burkholderia cepacia]
MSRRYARAHVFALIVMLTLCQATFAAQTTSIRLVTRWTGGVSKLKLSAVQHAWLAAHQGAVRVGVLRDEVVPLDIVDAAGNYEGISAEYLGILGMALKVRFEIVAFRDRAALMDALAAGTVDLVTGAQRASGRADVIFSKPYFGNRAVIATRIDDPGFSIRPSTDGRVLAYVQGTVAKSKLQKSYPDMRLLAVPSLSAALYAVAFGQAEACVGNSAALNDLIEWHQVLNVSVTDVARFAAEDFRFATSTQNQPLMQMVESMLTRIRDGDRDVILALWEGFGTHYTFGSDVSLSKAEREWIARHPVIKYAALQDFSPFIMANEDGTAMGLAVDLLNVIGKQTGLRFEPAAVDVASVRGSAADLIVAASPSDPTLANWIFTSRYSDTPETIVARTERSFDGMDALRGKRVVVGPSLWTDRAALNKAGATILTANSVWSASDLLTTRVADAWITNATTANYITQFDDRLAIVGATGNAATQIAFAVRPENAMLANILNNGLAAISASRMHGLRDRWQFSRQVRTSWDRQRLRILTIVLGTLLMIVLFLVWNYLLRKEIHLRKRAEGDLAAAIEVAEDASRAKSTFLATMSHEIRTPMNAVLGVLELLKQSRGTIESQSASIDAAYDSAHALLSLIEDILDLSKIESGKLELTPEPIDCDSLVRSVANVFEGLARQRHLLFSVNIDNPCRLGATIDPIRLRQILSNLLSNAVKFTHTGGVSLEAMLRADAQDQVHIELRIKDTGIGIAAGEQEKLFQPFVQADRTIGAKFGGSGLGLAICRRLVELMGGALTLKSTPGVGTTVEVRLSAPAAALINASDLRLGPIDVWRGKFRSYSALVVDDHPANRLVQSLQLQYLGFTVTSVQDGIEALDRMASTPFDVVITDFFMPGMTGYELAHQIRARDAASGHRVVLIGCTANAQQETQRRGLNAGMDFCVTKPLGLAALASRLSDWLCERETDMQARPPFASPSTDMPSEEWIDPAAVGRIVAGDAKLEANLLDTLVATNRDTLSKMRRMVANDDRAGFCAASHRIRSGIRLIGARMVVRACEYAERQATQTDVPLRELLPTIEADLGRLDEILTRRLNVLRGDNRGATCPDGLQA